MRFLRFQEKSFFFQKNSEFEEKDARKVLFFKNKNRSFSVYSTEKAHILARKNELLSVWVAKNYEKISNFEYLFSNILRKTKYHIFIFSG